MDVLRFQQACDKVIDRQRDKKGIGTLGEKTLHAVLKEYYEPDADSQEVRIGNYVADIVGENGIIEIQTRQLSRLVPKLRCFLQATDVTVVYPVAGVKYLLWLDEETGELTKPRKSPVKADEFSVLGELYPLREFISDPHFHFVVCFLEIYEIRSLNGWSRDRKKGSTRYDRIPKRLINEFRLDSRLDYIQYLPLALENDFTSAEFASAWNIDRNSARLMLNILESAGLVVRSGKSGKNILFSVAEDMLLNSGICDDV